MVARGWGIPAVVGANHLAVGDAEVRDEQGEILFRTGDVITIDGTTGEVWLGAANSQATEALQDDDILARDLPELAELAHLRQSGQDSQ
ncbi:hypothetical protein ACZ91_61160 [Streptomyces regensis]|nr:hypothetical protein ACZ91_61160 [Streptomyces regensis]